MIATVALSVMQRLSQHHRLPHTVETLTVCHSLLNSMEKEKRTMEQQHPPLALEETAIQDLVSHLRGTLLRPGDADYEQALRVYNGMIDKRPALIARGKDVADVIAAVNFA